MQKLTSVNVNNVEMYMCKENIVEMDICKREYRYTVVD